ncbi:MAG: class I SAM-dependent methyltransferase [Alphaproteobacteria bacterium]|nr:class I SAM-dependent methyltransferase [Alphaproteobacteria bacterium]
MLVWAVSDRFSTAAITEQFKAEEASGVTVRPEPMVLDLGSGSGINSVVPLRRIAPEAWTVAVDLSGELLALLADFVRRGAHPERVTCVRLDAVSPRLSPGLFDLVIGASILHHLDEPGVGVARAGRPEARRLRHLLRALRRLVDHPGAGADPGGGAAQGSALDPVVDDALRRILQHIAVRSHLRRREIDFTKLDDKWLFAPSHIEAAARRRAFRRCASCRSMITQASVATPSPCSFGWSRGGRTSRCPAERGTSWTASTRR